MLFVFQPFPGEDGGRQAADSSGEYGHAEGHCGRAGVRLPLVGLLTECGLGLGLIWVCSNRVVCLIAGHPEQV